VVKWISLVLSLFGIVHFWAISSIIYTLRFPILRMTQDIAFEMSVAVGFRHLLKLN
jgi:hypothetical protein